SNSRQKKINQWQHWTNEVIPSLITPYLVYLHKSTSLRDQIGLQQDQVNAFQCKSSYIDMLKIDCCTCAPAPLQLLARGYFSCTPIAPSLAVDLQLLELVKTLFVHITPNTTAWCATLKVFLTGHRYHLTTKVSQVPALSFGHVDQYYYRIIFVVDSVMPIIGTLYSA
ncbi:hypothetical protein DFJ58DRAFT_656529, partial [Suillus subalutaceus]|uniref:uncharacterized protein n=1 Tax=Suillus subalutaceus TaxID=48586 RepID=UPI001B86F596